MFVNSLSWNEKFESFFRFLVPYLLVLGLAMGNILSFSIPDYHDIRAPFILMVLYYWSIYRPTLIPPLMAFALGLMMDIFSGTMIGFYALLYILVQTIIRAQRLYFTGQPFIMVWIGFGCVLAVCGFIEWAGHSLVTMTILPVTKGILGYSAGLFLFPFVAFLMHLTHKLLPAPSRDLPRVK